MNSRHSQHAYAGVIAGPVTRSLCAASVSSWTPRPGRPLCRFFAQSDPDAHPLCAADRPCSGMVAFAFRSIFPKKCLFLPGRQRMRQKYRIAVAKRYRAAVRTGDSAWLHKMGKLGTELIHLKWPSAFQAGAACNLHSANTVSVISKQEGCVLFRSPVDFSVTGDS